MWSEAAAAKWGANSSKKTDRGGKRGQIGAGWESRRVPGEEQGGGGGERREEELRADGWVATAGRERACAGQAAQLDVSRATG